MAFLWATPEAITARKLDFVTHDVSSFIDNGFLERCVTDALRRSALKNKGLKEDDIEARCSRWMCEGQQSPLGKGCPQSANTCSLPRWEW